MQENTQERLPQLAPSVYDNSGRITNGSFQSPLTPEEVARFINQRTMFGRTLKDVAPLVPEEQDPTVLFRNNWLARGQAIQLVASSGVGKSSMAMQMAFNWAAGLAFLAAPIRPLKVAVIQAEDSERDVAEQIQGMRRGFTEVDGWTEELFNETLNGILCPTCFIGKQGDEFIAMLKQFQRCEKCDLIIVNPVQSFFGGDISQQEDVDHWCRGGIDPIIKSEDYGCGILLVMHTAKMVSGNKEGRANVEDYGEYIGAGSHAWLDWTRAKFVFLKHGSSEDYYDFKAAKRGKRLQWESTLGNPTTTKIFKHSDGFIFWQEVKEQAEVDNIATGTTYVSEGEAGKAADQIVAWIRLNRAVSKTELSEGLKLFKEFKFTRAKLRAARNIILSHLEDYHLTVSYCGTGGRRQEYIGFADSLKKAERMLEEATAIDKHNLFVAQLNAAIKSQKRDIVAPNEPPRAENPDQPTASEPTVEKKDPTFEVKADEQAQSIEQNAEYPF